MPWPSAADLPFPSFSVPSRHAWLPGWSWPCSALRPPTQKLPVFYRFAGSAGPCKMSGMFPGGSAFAPQWHLAAAPRLFPCLSGFRHSPGISLCTPCQVLPQPVLYMPGCPAGLDPAHCWHTSEKQCCTAVLFRHTCCWDGMRMSFFRWLCR